MYNPLLSVRFYQRFEYKDHAIVNPKSKLSTILKYKIHNNPKSIQHIPDAIPLLVTHETTKKDAIELETLCQFDVLPLEKCLALLQEVFFSNSIVNQYVFRSLRYHAKQNINNVIFYLPQLVLAMRNDSRGLLKQFSLDAARNVLTMAHQKIWLCQSQSYEGEDKIHGEQNDFCKMMENLVCFV